MKQVQKVTNYLNKSISQLDKDGPLSYSTFPLATLSCAGPGVNLISPYVRVICYHLGLFKRHKSPHTWNHATGTGCVSPQIFITSHWQGLIEAAISLAWWFMSDWGLCWTDIYWTPSYLCILAGDFLSHYPLAECGLFCCQTPNDGSSWWRNWENWVKDTENPAHLLSFSHFLPFYRMT